MRDKKKILAALPHLTERELWFVEFDCHRAADAAALGGASVARWQQYVDVEEAAKKEREKRFPNPSCPFPSACVDGWTDAQFEEMNRMYERIWRNGK